ncbi:MAG: hypothetical protein FOGNACKC_01948 [Anaerolineae bacterium]|nr:hypothetical protein [Anaerolineae bacterium]
MKTPENWRIEKLYDCLEKIIDYRGKSTPKDDDGVPLITARNVKEGYLDFATQEYMSVEDYENWMTRGLPIPGDVLFTTEAPLGNVAQYPNSGINYALAQRLVTLRTNQQILLPKYLMYYLLSTRGSQEVQIRATGSTATGIRQSELRKVPIPLPPLAEQRRIAEILGVWDDAISLTQRLIEAKQRRKQGLMQRLLTGSVRLPGFTGEWREVRLKNLGKISSGVGFPVNYQGKKDLPILFAKVSDMNLEGNEKYLQNANNTVDEEIIKNLKASVLKPGTLVFPKVGATLLTNKRRLIIKPTAVDNNVMAITPTKVDPEYLYYWSLTFDMARLVQSGALPSVNGSAVGSVKLTVPPLPEQRAIAAVLQTADEEMGLLERKLSALRAQKKGLMQKLLTGEVRVKAEG